jgi:predicted nucleic acid-binding protein
MELVIDTSAIVAVLLNEPEREALVRRTRGTTLLAPSSVHWQVGNALASTLRRGKADVRAALKALEIYRQIPLRLLDVRIEDAVQLSAEHRVYAYDAYVLACARKQRCPLLSLDKALLRVASTIGVDVIEVSP